MARRAVVLCVGMLAIGLAGCVGGPSAMTGFRRPGDEPPPPASVLCPAALSAPLTAEPPPPEGLTTDQVADALVAGLGPVDGAALFRWMMAEWRPWGQEAAARAGKAKAFCDGLAAKPPD